MYYYSRFHGFCKGSDPAAMETMKDIIQSPVFELPALFGSMALGLFASSASGSKVVKGGIKGVLPVLIIVMLPIGILTSYVLWKKGKIQVVDKEQK